MKIIDELEQKIKSRSITIGIVGLGYVGIPLAVRLSEVGFPVIGFDVLDDRVVQLNSGLSPISHIDNKTIAEMAAKNFFATTDFSQATKCDAILICVPTPLKKSREPDLTFVKNTMLQLKPFFREGQVVSLESTTWPGTTEEILLPHLTESGFKVGRNFFLLYAPEREDPGNRHFSTKNIPKVVGGHTRECKHIGCILYGAFVDEIVPVSSTKAAELVKLLENIHRAINIGLVNELKILSNAMDIDIFEVIDAASTKPFGFTPYYPGPGIGGHCIPIDPFYLTWKAREYGQNTRFIELAGEINASMPDYVVQVCVQALNSIGKSLRGSKVLILGLAYKRDVDDMRESPSVFIMEKLADWGASISYSDSNLPIFPLTGNLEEEDLIKHLTTVAETTSF